MNGRKEDPVVIIGGGIGGLSAAIHLATAGKQVRLLEKNDQVGGKMGVHQADGFYWDTGPSVITMPHVFADLFAAAGRKMEDYLTLRPVDPLTRYFYPEGTILNAYKDIQKMTAQMDADDAKGYRQFLAYAAELHSITGPVFIYSGPPTWRSFLRVPPADWLRVDGLRTMDKAINNYVNSSHLRQLLGRFATYVGASPYLAPATLNVIAHVELTGGVFYPQGGIYQVAQAFLRLAQELGVVVETGWGVQEIIVENGRATGVILESNDRIPAAAVISNLDVTNTYRHLLPGRDAQPPPDPSCSGFILLLGVAKTHPDLAHHNIFFSADYPAEFHQIFQEGRPPDDPTIYVAISAKSDPHHAPAGCENWFVLVNAPPLGEAYDWPAQAANYRNLVLQRLAEHGYDIRDHIRSEHMMTPLDLARNSGAFRGALYGASSNHRLAAFRRPHNRAKGIAGLYFAGGTTHPGGGVPMVTLSGRVAAKMLLADTGSRK